MYKIRICFEVDGLAQDEQNQPCPAGICMGLGESKNPVDYDKLAESVNVGAVLKFMGLEDVVDASGVRIITPEEYDEKYGDEDDG